MNRISPTLYKKLSAEDKTLLEKQESTRKIYLQLSLKMIMSDLLIDNLNFLNCKENLSII